jgi:hypothetical protein
MVRSRRRAIRSPVVGRVHDDRVLGDPQLVEQIQQFADLAVVIDHRLVVEPLTGDALDLLLDSGPEMHPRRVPPDEERFVVAVRVADELLGPIGDIVVDRLHPLLGQRTGCRTDRWRSQAASTSRRSSDPPVGGRDPSRHVDLGESGADRVPAGDERRSPVLTIVSAPTGSQPP